MQVFGAMVAIAIATCAGALIREITILASPDWRETSA